MGRPKDSEKLASIYRATLELTWANGLSGLKMQAIAQFAGVATGTVYVYFSNKAELINELYLDIKKRAATSLRKGYHPDASFMDGFEVVWRNYLNYLATKPEEPGFIEAAERSPYLRADVIREGGRMFRPFYDLLEHGKKIRLVANVPTDLLVAQLTGGLREMVRAERDGKIIFTPSVIRHMLTLSWNSVKR